MDATAWNHRDSLRERKPSSWRLFEFDNFVGKLVLGLVVLNLMFFNFLLVKKRFSEISNKITSPQPEMAIVAETLPSESKTAEELQTLRQDLESMAATVTAQLACLASSSEPVSVITQQVLGQQKVEPKLKYLNFPGARGTNSTTWWEVPDMEVVLNIANYPNYVATWEALLRVKNGEGKAYARIFDTAAGIPLEGSEIETGSDKLLRVFSGPLTFWPAERTYKIQIKSLYGTEAVIEEAKIKISWIETDN